MLQDEGSGYRTYVFEESTRRYAINRKGRGRKEVIYLHVADISYTRGIYKGTGLSYGAPIVGFRNINRIQDIVQIIIKEYLDY